MVCIIGLRLIRRPAPSVSAPCGVPGRLQGRHTPHAWACTGCGLASQVGRVLSLLQAWPAECCWNTSRKICGACSSNFREGGNQLPGGHYDSSACLQHAIDMVTWEKWERHVRPLGGDLQRHSLPCWHRRATLPQAGRRARLMVACSRRSCSRVAGSWPTSPVHMRYTRARKRCTPSTLRVFHTCRPRGRVRWGSQTGRGVNTGRFGTASRWRSRAPGPNSRRHATRTLPYRRNPRCRTQSTPTNPRQVTGWLGTACASRGVPWHRASAQ